MEEDLPITLAKMDGFQHLRSQSKFEVTVHRSGKDLFMSWDHKHQIRYEKLTPQVLKSIHFS